MSKETPKPYAINGTNDPVVKNWMDSGRDIYLDEFYFISYSDQKRALKSHGIEYHIEPGMSKKDFEEEEKRIAKELKEKFPKYFDIMAWVGMEQYKAKAIAELSPAQNPNYIRITGRMLIEWAEQGFVPQFDEFFERTRKLIMVPLQAWEHFHRFSYMLRKKGWYRNK